MREGEFSGREQASKSATFAQNHEIWSHWACLEKKNWARGKKPTNLGMLIFPFNSSGKLVFLGWRKSRNPSRHGSALWSKGPRVGPQETLPFLNLIYCPVQCCTQFRSILPLERQISMLPIVLPDFVRPRDLLRRRTLSFPFCLRRIWSLLSDIFDNIRTLNRRGILRCFIPAATFTPHSTLGKGE